MEIIIAIIIIVIAFLSIILLNIKEKGMRQTIIDLIVYAENSFVQGNNEQKFDFVFNSFDKLIKNPFLKLIFNEKTIKKMIQTVFDEIKIALDYQKGG